MPHRALKSITIGEVAIVPLSGVLHAVHMVDIWVLSSRPGLWLLFAHDKWGWWGTAETAETFRSANLARKIIDYRARCLSSPPFSPSLHMLGKCMQ